MAQFWSSALSYDPMTKLNIAGDIPHPSCALEHALADDLQAQVHLYCPCFYCYPPLTLSAIPSASYTDHAALVRVANAGENLER